MCCPAATLHHTGYEPDFGGSWAYTRGLMLSIGFHSPTDSSTKIVAARAGRLRSLDTLHD